MISSKPFSATTLTAAALTLGLCAFICTGCGRALTRSSAEELRRLSQVDALEAPVPQSPDLRLSQDDKGLSLFHPLETPAWEVASVAFWEPDEALLEPSTLFSSLADAPEQESSSSSLVDRILTDHVNYYSWETMGKLGIGLGVGGSLANSDADAKLNISFQKNFRRAESDELFEWLRAHKELGNGLYTLPIFATAWAGGELYDDSPAALVAGKWGERSLRSFLVGAPPVMIMQQVTGGSRPGETDHDAQWRPFHDNNGVSGHSFMGSLPFINAAKMTEDPWLKGAFYAGSTVAPLSRVNDAAHYPSQAALGWWMAFLAATAIDRTEAADSRWTFYPGIPSGDSGLTAELNY